MAEVTCSFCGRNKKDVDLMISGIHAHICDKCVTQANQILGEEKKSKTEAPFSPNFKLIKPVDIKKLNNVIFHCSPAIRESADGGYFVSSVTGTASFRFARYMKQLIEPYGIKAVIGKTGMPKRFGPLIVESDVRGNSLFEQTWRSDFAFG